MYGVNKTLYIPLYGKAFVSKKGVILRDKKAEEIWEAEGFVLDGRSRSKWLAYFMGMRAAVFDRWLTLQLAQKEQAAVLHIGCGMDSRVLRAGNGRNKWYDVDLPEVIAERRRYFAETADYRMIEGDARSGDWLSAVPEKKSAVVLMEGVSMYLSADEFRCLAEALCSHFEQVSLLTDCYSEFAARMSKYRNPINAVGVSKVYGIDSPRQLQGPLVFLRGHELTPDEYIGELHGYERLVFRNLYAGRMSKKLYRLYEYGKN